jgi:hypothetical protein
VPIILLTQKQTNTIPMKKITLVAAAVLVSFASFAQTWKVDKAHSKIGFIVTLQKKILVMPFLKYRLT